MTGNYLLQKLCAFAAKCAAEEAEAKAEEACNDPSCKKHSEKKDEEMPGNVGGNDDAKAIADKLAKCIKRAKCGKRANYSGKLASTVAGLIEKVGCGGKKRAKC